jgi:hypothetical protein
VLEGGSPGGGDGRGGSSDTAEAGGGSDAASPTGGASGDTAASGCGSGVAASDGTSVASKSITVGGRVRRVPGLSEGGRLPLTMRPF